MIAALYVQTGGVYYDLPDVDPWDEQRDARLYDGPWPVVAHPPCARWGQLANVNHARYGTPIGEDGGCFAAALAAVRTFGGVLEHPANSIAWRRFDLPKATRGCWTAKLGDPGAAGVATSRVVRWRWATAATASSASSSATTTRVLRYSASIHTTRAHRTTAFTTPLAATPR